MRHNVGQRRDPSPYRYARRPRAVWAMSVLITMGSAFPTTAFAQGQISYSPAAQIDEYGNARPVYQRIPLAAPQQGVERQPIRLQRWDAPSVNQRGVLGTLNLPTGLFARTIRQPGARPTYTGPTVRPQLTAWRRGALGRFGGFSERSGRGDPVNFGSLIERRYALIAATGLNSPVYRAMLAPAIDLGVKPQRQTAGDLEFSPAVTEPGLTFEQRLQWGVGLAHERIRAEAWQWFREDDFRRAARRFESAARLEPGDLESRIGELFCHLSLEAVRTAVAVQRSLRVRNVDPFTAGLNMSEKYSDPERARELGVESRLWGQSTARNADLLALHVLVQWYIGQRDEAVASAASYARDFANTGYADWPEMARAARAATNAQDDQP